tara:strand:- start:406 stop:732 length:327 start_codon:yes stop_codon:yes gene_type:complete
VKITKQLLREIIEEETRDLLGERSNLDPRIVDIIKAYNKLLNAANNMVATSRNQLRVLRALANKTDPKSQKLRTAIENAEIKSTEIRNTVISELAALNNEIINILKEE